MVRQLFCIFAFSAVVASASQTLHAATVFRIVSSPQSWVGQGNAYTFTDVTAFVAYNRGAYSNSVNFSAGGSLSYGFSLVSANQELPAVSVYTNVTRWPFMGAGPGMNFSGDGREDNKLTGSYYVLEAKYATNGQVAAFAVDFIQYDEGILSAWNQGGIRFNSSIPLPPIGAMVQSLPDWMAGYGRTGSIAAAAADADQDGDSNLEEYAFNSSPVTGAQRYLPTHMVTNGRLAIVVPRNPEATGITYVVEWSTKLGSWWSLTNFTPSLPTGKGKVVVSSSNMVGSPFRHEFLRVRITTP